MSKKKELKIENEELRMRLLYWDRNSFTRIGFFVWIRMGRTTGW